jgi:hypothetical protein
MPKVIRCPNCQAPLHVEVDQPLVVCEYCGHQIKQTVAIVPADPPPRRQRQRDHRQPPETSPLVTCRACQHPNPQHYKFCLGCGADLQAPADEPRPTPAREATSTPTQRRRSGGVGCLVVVVLLCAAGGVVYYRVRQAGLRSALTKASTSVSRLLGRRGEGALASDTPADQALATKLAAYTRCLNTHSNPLLSSRDRYLGWVDADAGPTCRERCVSWGVFEHTADRGPDGCAAAKLPQARELSPRLPALEAAGASYGRALQILVELLGQAHRYYDQRDYKEDGCAKGQQLHKPLLAAFAELEQADGAMRAALDKELPALLRRRLERARGEVFVAAYFKTLIDAHDLFGALRAQHAGVQSDRDAEGIRAMIASLQQSIDDAARAEAQSPDRSRDSLLWPHDFRSWVMPSALEVLKAAKEETRWRAAAAKVKPTKKKGRRRWVSREPYPTLVEKYNDLVRRASLPWPETRAVDTSSRCR